MLERDFQKALIKDIKKRLPEAIVLKNDGSNVPQGYPDLTVLYRDKWAMLECKLEDKSKKQKNQPYYVETFNNMSFASFICPDNKEEVLHAMEQSFGVER